MRETDFWWRERLLDPFLLRPTLPLDLHSYISLNILLLASTNCINFLTNTGLIMTYVTAHMGVIFWQMLFLNPFVWSFDFFFFLSLLMCKVTSMDFSNVEPVLHTGNKSYLVWCIIIFIHHCIGFANLLLRIFGIKLTRDISLLFYFSVVFVWFVFG